MSAMEWNGMERNGMMVDDKVSDYQYTSLKEIPWRRDSSI